MSDIFSRNVSNLGGVFTSDRAKLTFKGLLASLVQSLRLAYAQTITRLYEVGADNIYYVGGRTQGNMGVDRVVGPAGTLKTFYTQYGNVCNARGNLIGVALTETDCSGGSAGGTNGGISGVSNYDLRNCVITQVSFGVQAQDMIIGENTSLMFSSLELA